MKAVHEPASLPLFQGELWLARLRRKIPASVRRFESGHVLTPAGRAPAAVHVVMSGLVSVASTSRAGRRAVLALVGAGGVLGQDAVLPPVPGFGSLPDAGALPEAIGFPAVEVRAVVACTTLAFVARDLSEAAGRDPLIGLWLAASMSARLQDLERALARALSLPVKDRVLDLLLDLAERFGTPTPEGACIEAFLSQDDIGAVVGATRESVNRAFHQLVAAGAVRRESFGYVVRPMALAQAGEPGVS